MIDQDFWGEYEAFANNALSSGFRLFPNALKRWLALLDSEPLISIEVERLETLMNFSKWLAENEATQRGSIGSARLEFPIQTDQRLGAHVYLLRKAAENERFAVNFGHTFLTTVNNFDAMIGEYQRQIFQPLVPELRRHLERIISRSESAQEPSVEREVPASDRVVRLDHNSAAYRDAIESLNGLRDALAATNDYEDADDKAQQIAELSAGQELLKAPQLRIGAAKSVLLRSLKYLGEKFADGLIGELVKAALGLLLAVLGVHFLL